MAYPPPGPSITTLRPLCLNCYTGREFARSFSSCPKCVKCAIAVRCLETASATPITSLSVAGTSTSRACVRLSMARRGACGFALPASRAGRFRRPPSPVVYRYIRGATLIFGPLRLFLLRHLVETETLSVTFQFLKKGLLRRRLPEPKFRPSLTLAGGGPKIG